MAYDDNIYGVRKTPEPEVRDGWDMAVGTTGAAAQGAQIGSKFGPIGAGVGLAGGALLGYWGQESGKFQEEQRKEDSKAQNRFVDSLNDRDVRTTNMVRAQARYGMDMGQRYRTDVVEIEGDGSGDSINGIGEVHVDKNYNIKNAAVGGPTHEQGGVDIPAEAPEIGDDYLKDRSVDKGDIIFPWQNDPRKYEKGMSMIKRYKLNGDPRAKKWLDQEADRLPTDEDYGYTEDNNKEYPNGKGHDSKDPRFKPMLRKLLRNDPKVGLTKQQIRDMSEEEARSWYIDNGYGAPDDISDDQRRAEEARQFGNDMVRNRGNIARPTETENAASLGQKNAVDEQGNPQIIPETNTGGVNVTGGNPNDQNPKMRIIPGTEGKRWIEGNVEYVDMGDGWIMRKNHETGQLEGQREGADKWYDISKEEERGDPNQAGTSDVTNYEKTNDYYFGESKYEVVPSDIVEERIQQPEKKSIPTEEVPEEDQPMKRTMQDALREDSEDEPEGEDGVVNKTAKLVETLRGRRSNPLKYASAFNNFIQGNQSAEQVTRRYFTPEDLDYEDRSYSQRRAIAEQRNAANQMLRGKGLSIGQQQSYLGQTGARSLRAHEQVNETEARRADKIGQYNVGQRNRASMQNLQLANQYDIWDAQNRAARRKYLDQAYSDVSELAQVDEQKRYMMSRDEKADQIQRDTIPLMGTENFEYDQNNWNELQFKRGKQLNVNAGVKDPVVENEDGTYTLANGKTLRHLGRGRYIEIE